VDRGWIKLHRSLMDSAVYDNEKYLKIWIHILLKANHKLRKIIFNNKTILVKPGSFLTGRKKLSEGTGISEGTIERVLNYLESEQQIEQQKTSRNRLIIVINWIDYQVTEQRSGQPVDSQRTASGQPVDTNKKNKELENRKKKEKLLKRKSFFVDEVKTFITENTQYERVKEIFISYWTETNNEKTKMRRDRETFFDMGKRLGTFIKNNPAGKGNETVLEEWEKE